MTRGTLSGAKRAGPASKAKDRFLGGNRKKVLAFFAGTLFWEELEKQRYAVPQDAGKTPSACPSQRRTHIVGEDI